MVRLSLHTSQVAYQAGAYPGFCSMKRLGVFLLPPGWDTSYPRQISFAGTHLYTGVERDTVRVKCLAQKHNAIDPINKWRPIENSFESVKISPTSLVFGLIIQKNVYSKTRLFGVI